MKTRGKCATAAGLAAVVAVALAGGVPEPKACRGLGLREGIHLDDVAKDPANPAVAHALKEAQAVRTALDEFYRTVREMYVPPRPDMDRRKYPGGSREMDLANTSYTLTNEFSKSDSKEKSKERDDYAREWMLGNRSIAVAVEGFAKRFQNVRNVQLQTHIGAFDILRTGDDIVFDTHIPGPLTVYPYEAPGYNVIGCDEETLDLKWVNAERLGDPAEIYIVFCHDVNRCHWDIAATGTARVFPVKQWLAATDPARAK